MTAVVAAVLLSCTSLWAESNGKCGDNLTWTLDDNGVLTISGTGKMYDYRESPWKDLSIKKGVIKDGVTNIGASAFDGCSSLASVEIPSSVTSMEYGVFTSSGLTSVTFNAEKCTKMGEAYYSVFNDCKSIKTLTIGERVTMIPDFAF